MFTDDRPVTVDEAAVDDDLWVELDQLEAQAPTAENPPRPSRLAYQPALDGLRGLALLAILVYHAGFSWAPGAFLSVSTFFTLSGFLITALLLREHTMAKRIDRSAFYGRRIRRLLPTSLLAIVFIVFTAMKFGDHAQVSRLPGDALAGFANVSNWRFIAAGDNYGALFQTASPMQHFWSLAIEEQFYLLYPLVIAGLIAVTRGSRRLLGGALIGLAVLSLGVSLSLLAGGASIDRLYFGTDVRAAELLIGGVLAVWWMPGRRVMSSRRARSTVIIGGTVTLGVVLVLWRFASHEHTYWYQGGLAVYALATAFVILAAMQPIGPVRSILSFRPLVLLGLVSYSAYLFHWPVFVWINDRSGFSEWPLFILRLAVTLGLAIGAYFLVERPIRRGAVSARQALFVVPAVMAVTLLAAVLAARAQPSDVIDLQQAKAAALPPTKNPDFPNTPTVGLYGDSTAFTLGLGFGDWAKLHPEQLWIAGGWATFGCGTVEGNRRFRGKVIPYPPECKDWVESWRKAAAEGKTDVAVVLVGPWEVKETQARGDDAYRVLGDPALDRAIHDKLAQGVQVLRESGAKVVLLTSPAVDTDRVDGASPANRAPDSDPARMAHFNQIVREVATEAGDVKVVDLAGWIASRPDDDRRFRPDGVHYSWQGSRDVSAWVGPELVAAIR